MLRSVILSCAVLIMAHIGQLSPEQSWSASKVINTSEKSMYIIRNANKKSFAVPGFIFCISGIVHLM